MLIEETKLAYEQPIDAHYKNRKLAELYDLSCGWSVDRDFFMNLADMSRSQSILDLGCGTGLICNALASKGHDVTGVDLSKTMLSLAREKPFADKIHWVQASAQEFTSERKFDLVIMTGHSFQILFEESCVQKTFSRVRDYLKPDGLFAFESRNPEIDWPSRWNGKSEVSLQNGTVVRRSRRFLSLEDGLMAFELSSEFPDERITTQSRIQFWSQQQIERFLTASGLEVESMLGDWAGGPFKPATSEEMIFLVRHAR